MSEFESLAIELDNTTEQIPDKKRKPLKRIGATPRKPEARIRKSQLELQNTKKDVTELEAKSEIDSLTGLRNYKGLKRDLEEFLNVSKRYNLEMGLVEFDLDNFKGINDSIGHEKADEILISLATLVRNYTRNTDIVYRRSGDEFFILTPNTSNGDTVFLAERIKNAVQTELPVLAQKPEIDLSVSMGIAGYTPGKETNPETIDEVLERTNIALQNSKRNKNGEPLKNTVTVYQPNMIIPPGGEKGRG